MMPISTEKITTSETTVPSLVMMEDTSTVLRTKYTVLRAIIREKW